MSQLPRGWATASVLEIASLHDSRRVPLNATERAKMKGQFPYYGANGLVDHVNDYLFDGHYVLLAEDGGYFDDPSRPVAYEASGRFWVNNHAHILQPLGGVPHAFLKGALNTTNWLEYVGGSTRLKLTQGGLQQVPIRLPPIAEQRRIVAKIDSLSTKSGRARENLDRVPGLVEKYKQAILAAAFRGDLTREWRRRSGLSSDVRAFAGVPEELDGRLLPSEWNAAAIAEISINHDGKRIPVRASDRATRRGDYPYYGASGIIDQIDDYLFDGDFLLIGEDGANLLSRSTPIAFLASGKFWVNNHAHILQANDLTSNHWLHRLVNMIDLAPYVTGSAQPKLTQAALNRIVVPLPTLVEQAEILRLVDAAFSWIDRLAREAISARKLVDHLDQAVFAKAFRGELIAQDPSDEPATALLERIRVERAKAATSGRRRRA